MDIQAEKLNLIEKLTQLTDANIIEKLKAVISQEYPIDIEEYNKELEDADLEIEKSIFLSHSKAVEEIKGWRKS